jgi:hypothetical protein
MFCVYKTDPDWINVVKDLTAENQICFWRRNTNNFNLPKSSWFYFNLRGSKTFVGRAVFVRQELLPIPKAWELYGIGNGVSSLEIFRQRATEVLGIDDQDAVIGCILLADLQLLKPQNYFEATSEEYPSTQSPFRYFERTVEDAQFPRLQNYFAEIFKSQSIQPNAVVKYFEGAENYSYRRGFERNPEARMKCLEFHGFKCKACGILLEEKYGPIARGFIHVHHLSPLAESDSSHEIDPIKELAPLCPNCHCIAHRRQPPFSIDELKTFLGKQ